jgi:hypothetical protein
MVSRSTVLESAPLLATSQRLNGPLHTAGDPMRPKVCHRWQSEVASWSAPVFLIAAGPC